MKRLASKRQKVTLFILQDGKCALCGDPLGDEFQADHVFPYSQNGETKLCNLQLLCMVCHSAKTRAMDKCGFSTRQQKPTSKT